MGPLNYTLFSLCLHPTLGRRPYCANIAETRHKHSSRTFALSVFQHLTFHTNHTLSLWHSLHCKMETTCLNSSFTTFWVEDLLRITTYRTHGLANCPHLWKRHQFVRPDKIIANLDLLILGYGFDVVKSVTDQIPLCPVKPYTISWQT